MFGNARMVGNTSACQDMTMFQVKGSKLYKVK